MSGLWAKTKCNEEDNFLCRNLFGWPTNCGFTAKTSIFEMFLFFFWHSMRINDNLSSILDDWHKPMWDIMRRHVNNFPYLLLLRKIFSRLNECDYIKLLLFWVRIQWPVIETETFQFLVEIAVRWKALFYSGEIDSFFLWLLIIKMTHDSDICGKYSWHYLPVRWVRIWNFLPFCGFWFTKCEENEIFLDWSILIEIIAQICLH